jgi:hypothetical protein
MTNLLMDARSIKFARDMPLEVVAILVEKKHLLSLLLAVFGNYEFQGNSYFVLFGN